ncbi:MAG TPA: outer membrane beta-barrel protein [Chitinophaga sp.]|uniref:outer membrane beta-barrel protein n=1 Tax=Chitinophaga sp. TaxID=1869181 RepID=UPI002BC31DF7|nr:outer membrane beta-barrel protein [Chitinophaga sp.]HVI46420.1 outer membrane beta-barrel protein [Chitinophaga sp.]
MSKIYKCIFFFLCCLPIIGSAQQLHTVIVDNASHKPLQGAAVKITAPDDSATIRSSQTSQQGVVSFSNLHNGDYEMKIHSLGYPDKSVPFSIPRGRFPALPDTISVSTAGIQLKEVAIKDNTPPVSMKGDTIEYNANKFKTKENAVVEDLLRKLPGVKVDKDGSIKAQGETVQRVLVDGKEFFGSDPSIATRNLPADMIDKVQVLDKKSDMEEFTGVADGQQQKTINLVTKKNRKRGYFGNMNAGHSGNGQYEGGINANSFVGDMQLSMLLKGNNVNKSGFSAAELIKMLGANPQMFNNLPPSALSELTRMKGVRIEGGAESMAELARPSGLTDTKFGGLNFNNDWGDKLKLRSSYFFNDNNSRNTYDYARQYRLQDTSYNYLQNGATGSRNTNQRIDLSAETVMDKRTSFKATAHADLNAYNNSSSRNFSSYTADGVKLLNEGHQLTATDGRSSMGNIDLLFRRRLAKPGRTIVLDVKPEFYRDNATMANKSTSTFYNLPTGTSAQNIDQQTFNKSSVFSINGNFVYTEPLSKAYSLQLGQQLYFSRGDYNTTVNDKDPGSGHYTVPNTLLSDAYTADNLQYTTKLLLSASYKRFHYTIGAGWRTNHLQGSSDLKGYRIDERYNALLPEAYAEWKVNSKEKMIFRYNANAAAPSVSRLQPLTDNSDPLYIRKGNPSLQQEKNQRWALSYNKVDLSGNSFFLTTDFTWNNNQITDSTSIDKTTGKQLTMPVNVKGNFSSSMSAGKSFNIGLNNSSVSAGISLSYSKNTLYNNGLANENRTVSVTPDFSFNLYPTNKISIEGRGSAAYNKRHFSASTTLPGENWLLNYGLETTVLLPFRLTFDAGLDGYSTLGMSAGFNNTILLVNTGLSREIGKHFTLQLSARDLLNRNEGLNRITGNGYIEDRRNIALGRYFMLSAVYKFRHFPKSKSK